MKRLIVIAAMLMAATAQAQVQQFDYHFETGNSLLSKMRGTPDQLIQAVAYVSGVNDIALGDTHCPGSNVTRGQLSDIVQRFLEDNPAARHQSGALLTAVALSEAFPCRKNGKTY